MTGVKGRVRKSAGPGVGGSGRQARFCEKWMKYGLQNRAYDAIIDLSLFPARAPE